jgi:hypothetical protein
MMRADTVTAQASTSPTGASLSLASRVSEIFEMAERIQNYCTSIPCALYPPYPAEAAPEGFVGNSFTERLSATQDLLNDIENKLHRISGDLNGNPSAIPR